MGSHGDVVGEDGNVEVFRDRAEVLFDFGRIGQCIERGGDHGSVSADREQALGLVEDAAGRLFADADQNRDPTSGGFERDGQHLIAFGRGEIGDLT